MTYLNPACIEGVSSSAFQAQKPYPWAHMQGTLTAAGWERLRATLPDMTQFQRMVGVKRSFGQAPHNRGILHYREGMGVAGPWKEFIAELHGKAYDGFLRRMLGLGPRQQIILTMEWYYAWQGCSVSPHCDARRKLATHIFYFNTEDDWDTNWGGQILMLDDAGKCKPDLRADRSFLAWRASTAVSSKHASQAVYSHRQRAHDASVVEASQGQGSGWLSDQGQLMSNTAPPSITARAKGT